MKTAEELDREFDEADRKAWSECTAGVITRTQYNRILDTLWNEYRSGMRFWKATPTQQLCSVARMLKDEAGGKE